MKFSFIIVAFVAATLFTFNATAQTIHHAKTATVRVYGNCGMCEKTIEKAGRKGKIANVDWDQDTQMARITFDSTKTSVDVVLQRIAAAGYDSDAFRAPDSVYAGLHSCCQYERPAKPEGAAIRKTAKVTRQ